MLSFSETQHGQLRGVYVGLDPSCPSNLHTKVPPCYFNPFEHDVLIDTSLHSHDQTSNALHISSPSRSDLAKSKFLKHLLPNTTKELSNGSKFGTDFGLLYPGSRDQFHATHILYSAHGGEGEVVLNNRTLLSYARLASSVNKICVVVIDESKHLSFEFCKDVL
ncbi:hypothetical protein P9112_007722 [Eukaryota sp. TZLM1-RC]